VNSYDKTKRRLVFTDEGRTTVFKQGNGLKFANIGFALVKDSRKYLFKKVRGGSSEETITPDFSKLKDLTISDILTNCDVIFNKVSYKDVGGSLQPVSYKQQSNAKKSLASYLFPIYYSYQFDEDEEADKKAYISYDVYIKPGMISIADWANDLEFDAIIYFALPFKPERQNKGLGDKQTAAMFGINYFTDDKVMILKDQNARLVFNVEAHFHFDTFDPVPVSLPADYNPNCLHIVNNKVTNTVLTDANTLGTTDNLLIM
jgi:hypothetical protein